MSTLLEISEDLLAFRTLLDDSTEDTDGEVSQEAAAALDQWFAELSDRRDAKLLGYRAYIKSEQRKAACRVAEAEQLEAEAKRLRAFARARDNRAEWLKDCLADFMRAQGVRKIEGDGYKFTLQTNGGKQAVDVSGCEPRDLPPQHQIVHVTANKDTLRDALLAGERIGGVVLVPKGEHVRVN